MLVRCQTSPTATFQGCAPHFPEVTVDTVSVSCLHNVGICLNFVNCESNIVNLTHLRAVFIMPISFHFIISVMQTNILILVPFSPQDTNQPEALVCCEMSYCVN